MIWFTSDWHIGHDKDFLYKPRGFSNIFEHDATVLKNCNSLVKPEDTLYILGDLAMSSNEKEWNSIFYNILCQDIHVIRGNHDTDEKLKKYVFEYGFTFHGWADMFKASKTKRFYLSHYPTLTGNFDFDRIPTWNISGHTHSKEKFHSSGCIYNVALDAHNNFPVSLEQIIKDIDKYTRTYKEPRA